ALMVPAMLLTIGLLFLIAELVPFAGLSHTWPAILIVIGLVRVFQGNASTAGHLGPPSAPGEAPPTGGSTGEVQPPPNEIQSPPTEVHNGYPSPSATSIAASSLVRRAGGADYPRDSPAPGDDGSGAIGAIAALVWKLLARADHSLGSDQADRTPSRRARRSSPTRNRRRRRAPVDYAHYLRAGSYAGL